jgi:predicted HicB family RNase H-like nuclease
MMEYKGYQATVEYDDEADLFHGEVLNTRAVITFQGRSVDDLRRELAESVEDYLEWCAERGKEPEKPYSGRLLVRTTPEIHRAVATAAARERESVNAWVSRTLATATNISSLGDTGRPSRKRRARSLNRPSAATANRC